MPPNRRLDPPAGPSRGAARSHPLFAALYDRITAPLEREVLGPRRANLLAGLGGRVLEVGAGTGASLPHFRDAALVVASEPDPAIRKRMGSRLAEARVVVEVSDAAAESLPFDDASLDAVVFVCTLCTVADPEHGLTEARRVLRPDGRLVAVEHVRGEGRLARWQEGDAALATDRRRLPSEPRHAGDD
jgi:ubiquinone/menaquinone biosynthesis C-methylase UbiE